jgi:hypothetical protein
MATTLGPATRTHKTSEVGPSPRPSLDGGQDLTGAVACREVDRLVVGRLGACYLPRTRMGDSLAVELPALDRAALVRIQVPQPAPSGSSISLGPPPRLTTPARLRDTTHHLYERRREFSDPASLRHFRTGAWAAAASALAAFGSLVRRFSINSRSGQADHRRRAVPVTACSTVSLWPPCYRSARSSPEQITSSAGRVMRGRCHAYGSAAEPRRTLRGPARPRAAGQARP